MWHSNTLPGDGLFIVHVLFGILHVHHDCHVCRGGVPVAIVVPVMVCATVVMPLIVCVMIAFVCVMPVMMSVIGFMVWLTVCLPWCLS